MHFIIKFFPEITIKSTPVRKRFIKQLRRNLRRLLTAVDERIEVVGSWDKMDVRGPTDLPQLSEQVADILACTPGIAYFARAQVFSFGSIDEIAERALALWQGTLQHTTFAVRVKRSGKHDFNSIDVEKQVGAVLNQVCATAKVQLKDPAITVRMEVVNEHCYLIEEQRPGLGGFPIGTQDAVLSLVSGGFDSTVASYLTTKRGLTTHFCFFNLGGHAHELGVKEVSYYLWRKFGASHKVKFITVPFEEVVAEILKSIHHSQMGVVLKRMMLRAATEVAKQQEILALVTGESVAQVSSQTLTNLSVIDRVTDHLVLRPLITADKGEIIDISRRIGTEEFAASMPEYCGVISDKPTTRASLERIESEEANFDFSVLDAAIAEQRIESITAVADNLALPKTPQLYAELPAGVTLIDVRHPNEVERQLLSDEVRTAVSKSGATLINIPFYRLNTEIAKYGDTLCLLYCDKGVMSQLHAAHLLDSGQQNVGVYRPEK